MWLCDPNRRAETLLRLAGRDYYLLGGASRAGSVLRWLGRAVDLAPGPRTYLALAMARWERGVSAMAAGWMEAAEAAHGPSAAAPDRPAAPDFWLTPPPEGTAGEEEFARTLQLDRGNAAAPLILGFLSLWRGQPAGEHLRAVAAAEPENALPYYLTAYARAAAGDAEGALAELDAGNARPECRFPISPAVEAVDGSRFAHDDAFMPALLLMVGQIAWSLIGKKETPASGTCPGEEVLAADAGELPAMVTASLSGEEMPPSLVRRLMEAGRHEGAFRVCEAVWEMGRKLSGAKPMTTMRGIWASVFLESAARAIGTVSLASGDADLRARAAALQEAMAKARVFRHEEVTRQTRGYMAGFWRRVLWEWAGPWAALLPTLVAISAGIQVSAVSSAAGAALLLVGAVALAASIAMRRLGFVLPARWFRDPERDVLERYLAMLPPAGDTMAAVKEG